MTELLDLPVFSGNEHERVRERLATAAQEPVKIYVQTRNVAAHITAGTLATAIGLVLLHEFIPGEILPCALANHVTPDRYSSMKRPPRFYLIDLRVRIPRIADSSPAHG